MFPDNLNQRHALFIQKIQAGEFQHDWHELTINHNGHVIVLFVSRDALKIDNIRINVSAKIEQDIADILGASLITAKIADLIYSNATIKVPPFPQMITSSTNAMMEHSRKIDNYIAVHYPGQVGLISNTGKHWILDNRVGANHMACNYGWHLDGGGTNWKGIKIYPAVSDKSLRVIQPNATAHNYAHSDYSQTVTLIHNNCLVDGQYQSYEDLLKGNLWEAISTEKLTVFKQA